MKPYLSIPFAILCATVTVFGQNLDLPLHASPSGTLAYNCPVGLQVDHGFWFERREVAGASQTGPQQQLHLTLTNLHPQKIVAAQLTVYGLSQRSRFREVSAPVPDMQKKIQLSMDIEGNGQASNDVSLHHFAVVTTVDLDAVTYADGSTWRQSSPAACSVTPSALMRVSTAP